METFVYDLHIVAMDEQVEKKWNGKRNLKKKMLFLTMVDEE